MDGGIVHGWVGRVKGMIDGWVGGALSVYRACMREGLSTICLRGVVIEHIAPSRD